MSHPKTLAALLCLSCAAAAAEPPAAPPPAPIVTQVLRQDLPDMPGCSSNTRPAASIPSTGTTPTA